MIERHVYARWIIVDAIFVHAAVVFAHYSTKEHNDEASKKSDIKKNLQHRIVLKNGFDL